MSEGTHETLGRHFRTPAHPDVLMALGRAQYNFMALEETVVAIFYEAGFLGLAQSRVLMAGAKVKMLRALADTYRASTNGQQEAAIIDSAIVAFDDLRATVRNRLSHAHPFTAGVDGKGDYLPGLAHTFQDRSTQGIVGRTIAVKPDDLLDLATKIEDAINPLEAARAAVTALPVSKLT